MLAYDSVIREYGFREGFSHPYISFFHLLVECFSVTLYPRLIIIIRQLLQTGFLRVMPEASAT